MRGEWYASQEVSISLVVYKASEAYPGFLSGSQCPMSPVATLLGLCVVAGLFEIAGAIWSGSGGGKELRGLSEL